MKKIEPLDLDKFLSFPEGSIHDVPRLARKINEIIDALQAKDAEEAE